MTEPNQPPPSVPNLIAAIGFAADDLTALQKLMTALPSDSGMAFVLAPQQPIEDVAGLAANLTDSSSLPVHVTHDSTVIAADTVYLLDGTMRLIMAEGVLQSAVDNNEPPVDALFQSLADAQHSAAIGILLEGVDSFRGLKAIAEAGGLTIAQDSIAAKSERGLRDHITIGDIDYLLSPEQMPAELIDYASHLKKNRDHDRLDEQITHHLPTICDLLLEETQHDFKHYKTPMLVRRIQHRLQVLRVADVNQYIEQLRESSSERRTLFRKLLVDVTVFFRDPQTFQTLADHAIPALLNKTSPDKTLRIWVPGCATGEEAYTLAILFKEQMASLNDPPGLQIFATDIKESALKTAREGRYSETITENLEAERLNRFFEKVGNEYQIKQEIRELCLFSNHNLINDPPFTDIDLISCRNLLIYLGPHLQKKLFSVFHHALRFDGYLLLGPAENVSTHKELFDVISARHRLCQRKEIVLNGKTNSDKSKHQKNKKDRSATTPIDPDELDRLTQRILLDEFAPKYAVIDDTGNVLLLSPNISKYLEPAAGRFTGSLLRMARQGLSAGLRATFDKAKQVRRQVINDNLSVNTDQGLQQVMLTVQPMPDLGEANPLHMVVFQDIGLPITREVSKSDNASTLIVAQLEEELSRTRIDLDHTVKQLEKANEELKVSNEELLTMNEELLSSNAALETAKEDVEISNSSLAQINNDLHNLLDSTQIATLFLDEDTTIRFFTPAMGDLYNLKPGDVGRPLSDITHRFQITHSLPDPKSLVTQNGASAHLQHELQTVDGRWYIRRALPYRTSEGSQKGMVVTFTEVTELRASEARVRRQMLELETLYHTAPIGLALFDTQQRYLRINERLADINGLAPEKHIGHTLPELFPELAKVVGPLLEKIVASGEPILDIEVVGRTARTPDTDQVWLASYYPLKRSDGSVEAINAVVLEITQRKQDEEALRESSRSKDDYVAMLAHELRNPLAPLRNAAQVLNIMDLTDPRLIELSGIIDRQVEHMANMLDDLLDVSRISRGKMQIERDKLDLNELLQQTIEDIGPAIEDKGLTLEVHAPKESWWMLGDATRLTQVFNNLLRNAIKFTPKGGHIQVCINAADQDADTNAALITVNDNGVGMTPDMAPRVFEPFWQGENAKHSASLGLGLALVKGFVELHDGTVWANSPGPGKGSEFSVRLPLLQRPSRSASSTEAETTAHKVLRILVIDDLQDTADTLKLLLEHEGHRVSVAYSGQAGITTAREFVPDVVLCDIGLQDGMDGYAVARAFRNDAKLSGTYMIAVTGYGRGQDRDEANDAGFNDYLLKPVSLEDLYQALARRH